MGYNVHIQFIHSYTLMLNWAWRVLKSKARVFVLCKSLSHTYLINSLHCLFSVIFYNCRKFVFLGDIVKPSLADTAVFQNDYVKIVATGAPVPCAARSPANMVLIKQNRWDGFQPPVPYKCWEMIDGVNIFLYFLYKSQQLTCLSMKCE